MYQALVEMAKTPCSPLLQVKRIVHTFISFILFYSCYFSYGLTLTESFKSGKFVSDLLRHPHFSPKTTIAREFSCAKDLISRRILHNFFPRLSFICHHDESQEIAVKEARKASKEEKNHKQEENNRTQHKDHSSLRVDLRKIEKNDLERRDANKISYRCRRPDVPTRPPFHPTAACQRQISRVVMHPTPMHFPPTTTTIERVEDFFQTSDDWFYLSSELHCA